MAEIIVPTLGESVSEATVAQWLKKEGDSVAPDEPIVELETDKVTLEVNSPSGGVIAKISAPAGTNVEVGAILGMIGEGQGAEPAPAANESKEQPLAPVTAPAPQPEPVPAPAPVQQEVPAPVQQQQSASMQANEQTLSPSVRKMVADNGVDPSSINGSGKDGRVTKEDVQQVVQQQSAQPAPQVEQAPAPVQTAPQPQAEPSKAESAAPAPTPAKAAVAPRTDNDREERVKMTRLRQAIAKRLKEAQETAAMLTTFNEVDMQAVMEMRSTYKDNFEKKHGVKLGFMSFFVKAAIAALKDFPAVNAEIDGTDIVYKNYYDVGVAVSTPQGLVVPVVRDADDKNMAEIESSIIDLGTKAKDGKLSMADMSGGTFTITNGGVFGSLMSTPILNSPQVGILGMHKIQKRPMAMPDGSIEVRPMMYLALSYDHRIVDGREAVSFLVRIKEALEDPQRLLLDL